MVRVGPTREYQRSPFCPEISKCLRVLTSPKPWFKLILWILEYDIYYQVLQYQPLVARFCMFTRCASFVCALRFAVRYQRRPACFCSGWVIFDFRFFSFFCSSFLASRMKQWAVFDVKLDLVYTSNKVVYSALFKIMAFSCSFVHAVCLHMRPATEKTVSINLRLNFF